MHNVGNGVAATGKFSIRPTLHNLETLVCLLYRRLLLHVESRSLIANRITAETGSIIDPTIATGVIARDFTAIGWVCSPIRSTAKAAVCDTETAVWLIIGAWDLITTLILAIPLRLIVFGAGDFVAPLYLSLPSRLLVIRARELIATLRLFLPFRLLVIRARGLIATLRLFLPFRLLVIRARGLITTLRLFLPFRLLVIRARGLITTLRLVKPIGLFLIGARVSIATLRLTRPVGLSSTRPRASRTIGIARLLAVRAAGPLRLLAACDVRPRWLVVIVAT